MPTPSSGQIAFSDIAWIVYNNYAGQVSLNDSDVRTLSGVASGEIAITSAYNKPTAGNTGTTYYTPGTYSWIVVPYKTLTANVAGGGGGGGGACSGEAFFYGCVNLCGGTAGGVGGNTTFNGVTAYRGTGGAACSSAAGANGGNSINGTLGGGGAGGTAGTAGGNCNQSNGARGGTGGYVSVSWTKAVTGPSYGASLSLTVGARGLGGRTDCRGVAGGNGANGYIQISWS